MRTWTDLRESDWSQRLVVEAGLLGEPDWTADGTYEVGPGTHRW